MAGTESNSEIPFFRKTRVGYNTPGQAHELTFSCHKRLPLLNNDRTRDWFIAALDATRLQLEFELWAYVVMPEHAHVLFCPLHRDYQIATILSALKLRVSRRAIGWLRSNAPHELEKLKVSWPSGRIEYRFWQQGGGYDRNIIKPETAWKSIQYLHNNPVHRGLVGRDVDWQWSSARSYSKEGGEVLLAVDGCPPDR